MTDFQFVAIRKELDHDSSYKAPHVSVAFTVGGWKNSWNADCTEYMDVSGILTEEKANLILAAPDLLALVIQYRGDLLRTPSPESMERRFAAIEAALAKVEGRA